MQFVNVSDYYSICTACCIMLSVFVICLVAVLLLKALVLFCVWVGLLLPSPYMVCYSVCFFKLIV